jgi:dTDP-4-amino-4,6-dideoxygalactose transaminase
VVTADVPVAESVARRCLSLPVHHHLTDAELDTVVDRFRRALGAQP